MLFVEKKLSKNNKTYIALYCLRNDTAIFLTYDSIVISRLLCCRPFELHKLLINVGDKIEIN